VTGDSRDQCFAIGNIITADGQDKPRAKRFGEDWREFSSSNDRDHGPRSDGLKAYQQGGEVQE